MVYKGKYRLYYFLPIFWALFLIALLFIPMDVRGVLPIVTFCILFVLLVICFSLVILFDIIRGFKIANDIEKLTREKIVKENKELLFTFISAISVIHITSLGVEYYNSKTIYLGRVRKYKNKDFFIRFEEIAKIKNTNDLCFLTLKDESKIVVSFDSNKEAMNEFIKIIKTKIK